MQKFSLHYHSFVLIIALYHSVRKIILCWLAAAVTEITTQQYYFQHFRNMLHECLVFLDFVKAAFSCAQNHATTTIAILWSKSGHQWPMQWYFNFAVWIKPTFSHYPLLLRPKWLFNTKIKIFLSQTDTDTGMNVINPIQLLSKRFLHNYLR